MSDTAKQHELVDYISSRKYNSNNDVIPGIRQHYVDYKKTCVKKITNLTPATNFTADYFEKNIVGTYGNAIDNVYDTLTFVESNLNSVFYDDVVSVEPLDSNHTVVDFRFPSNDMLFIANGILTHNCHPETLSLIAFNPKTRSLITLDYPTTKAMIERYESIVGDDTSIRKEILNL